MIACVIFTRKPWLEDGTSLLNHKKTKTRIRCSWERKWRYSSISFYWSYDDCCWCGRLLWPTNIRHPFCDRILNLMTNTCRLALVHQARIVSAFLHAWLFISRKRKQWLVCFCSSYESYWHYRRSHKLFKCSNKNVGESAYY